MEIAFDTLPVNNLYFYLPLYPARDSVDRVSINTLCSLLSAHFTRNCVLNCVTQRCALSCLQSDKMKVIHVYS